MPQRERESEFIPRNTMLLPGSRRFFWDSLKEHAPVNSSSPRTWYCKASHCPREQRSKNFTKMFWRKETLEGPSLAEYRSLNSKYTSLLYDFKWECIEKIWKNYQEGSNINILSFLCNISTGKNVKIQGKRRKSRSSPTLVLTEPPVSGTPGFSPLQCPDHWIYN